MAFNFHVDPGVRVEEELYSRVLKPGRAEKLHGDIKHIQCHAENRFSVTMANGETKEIRGQSSLRRVWNFVQMDRAFEPDRLYSYLSEKHGGVKRVERDAAVYFDVVFRSKKNEDKTFEVTVTQAELDAVVSKHSAASKVAITRQNLDSHYIVEFMDGFKKTIHGLHNATVKSQLEKQAAEDSHRKVRHSGLSAAAEAIKPKLPQGADERMAANQAAAPAPIDAEAANRRFARW